MIPSRVKINGKYVAHPGNGALMLAKSKARSRITNGLELLPGIDHRSVWYRRFRDLNALIAIDLGGDPSAMSEGQRSLVRRASALCVELELMETRFAKNGGSKLDELETFQRATNSLRRLLESLGIHRGRIPKSINPAPTLSQYLTTQQRRRPPVIDAEPTEEAEDA